MPSVGGRRESNGEGKDEVAEVKEPVRVANNPGNDSTAAIFDVGYCVSCVYYFVKIRGNLGTILSYLPCASEGLGISLVCG
jgi:hypothetical protein